MKTAFLCSLIHKGLLGGRLFLNEKAITYKTNKLTVDSRYRNLVLPLKTIQSVTWKKGLPIVTFSTTDGESVSFLLFNKRRFVKCYQTLTKCFFHQKSHPVWDGFFASRLKAFPPRA